MAKPKTTIRYGTRKGKVVVTKPGKGLISKVIKVVTGR